MSVTNNIKDTKGTEEATNSTRGSNNISNANSANENFSTKSVGSRIKSNFKALCTRYCNAMKTGEKDDPMKTGEKFAAAFIGVFM